MAPLILERDSDQPKSRTSVIRSLQKGSRAATFDPGYGGGLPKTAAEGNAVRARLQGIIKSLPIAKYNSYRHEPIDHNNEIRILKILHGKPEDDLECMLFPSALGASSTSNCPKYKYWALSYWWGDEKEVANNRITIYHDTGGRGASQEMTRFNPSGSFHVRNNLKAALLQFRDPEDDVNVWVDALCIDQGNKEEKKAQVARMHEVYTQAENVCVWLGEGRERTSETFNFLRELLYLDELDRLVADPLPTARKWAMVIDLMSNRWFSRRWVIQELALSRKASIRWGNEELEWTNFADAIALFMTKYDQIKRTSLDPADYHKDIDARALGAYTIVHATTNLFRKSPTGEVRQRLLPLEILVSSLLLAFEASEPRDTIFAVLTLARDSQYAQNGPQAAEDPRIAPDYDKSLFDVYADFMHYCIEKSESLDILCRYWAPLPKQRNLEEALKHGTSSREEEKMPTWIPFITGSPFGEPHGVLGGRVNGDSFVGGAERKGQQTYHACGGLKAWVKFGLNEDHDKSLNLLKHAKTFPANYNKQQNNPKTQVSKNTERDENRPINGSAKNQRSHGHPKPTSQKYDGTLQVKGFCLDIVDEVSERVRGSGMIPEEALSMGGWVHKSPPDPLQDVPDPLWRTLVADRGPNGTSAPGWYRRTCLECLQHTDRAGDLDIEKLQTKANPATPSTMITLLERIQQIVWGRRFFKTKGNPSKREEPLFGLGSQKIKRGDMICILFGCSVPVVLRKVSEGGNQYCEFIGECYVHGMMDGEAISPGPPKKSYLGKKVTIYKLR